jgi:hypothetical protein
MLWAACCAILLNQVSLFISFRVHLPIIIRPSGAYLFRPAGVIDPPEAAGVSLVPAMEGRRWGKTAEIVMQQQKDLAAAVHTADWQIILQRQDEACWPLYPLHAGDLELYDQRADSGQEHNLWPDPAPAAQQAQQGLLRLLVRWEERTAAASGTASSLDEETLEMLRRLGY